MCCTWTKSVVNAREYKVAANSLSILMCIKYWTFCRVLKTWHKVAGDKVIALMSLDLVSAKSRWAAGIKELREFFIRVEQDGFSMQSQAVWRLHWDHQIYKVSKPALNQHSPMPTFVHRAVSTCLISV